ncbi:MAG TPA: GNAT family N-acetyltransferase [Anaerolineales bacterium]|nr:GNAT family N-acetyltransferase [Anaerolineales bacterium]
MYIEKVTECTEEIFVAVLRLVPYIGAHKTLPTQQEIHSLIKSESSTLWVARYPDPTGIIAGMLTAAIYRVPTGLRSIVEDVVVEPNFRRLGIARALLQTAIDFAREAGANGVALTSNPKREAANLLYKSLGFERRDTNSYFYRI